MPELQARIGDNMGIFGKPEYNSLGIAEIVTRTGENSAMLQDIYCIRMKAGDVRTFLSDTDETAILLLEGEIEFKWNDKSFKASRGNVFDDGMYALHISRSTRAQVVALTDCEILTQATDNERTFEPKLYTPEDCQDVISGENLCKGTCVRLVRTAFDYNNAPYSNMVLGEVISNQGSWSSYIPHWHPQPEVYYYKFDKPQGFGAGFAGDDAFKIVDGSFLAIPGGKTHPHSTAPGYRMYFVWMIRHLPGNPWTDRIDDPDHTWLYDYK